jgi:predicted N-acetyltransferase YhbS
MLLHPPCASLFAIAAISRDEGSSPDLGCGRARRILRREPPSILVFRYRQVCAMTTMPSASIRLQTPDDHAALVSLNETAFGPGRFARTAYRVREGSAGEPRLSLCAVLDGEIIGAVQFTPIAIGGVPGALLLGPLLIADGHKNHGHGLRLMREGLRRAAGLGYKLVVLVGDLPYYARAGFCATPHGRIVMPGPVDPARILCVELMPGALEGYRGLVRGLSQKP